MNPLLPFIAACAFLAAAVYIGYILGTHAARAMLSKEYERGKEDGAADGWLVCYFEQVKLEKLRRNRLGQFQPVRRLNGNHPRLEGSA